ncbi:hypothetical protein SAMN04489759_11544 [Sulfitobacter delicatus]|uniref:Uncharacterized protein n=1 Tax=Sulfitobacter delicatus TaxID=218672 RepID=A0A1G7YHE8_9RHOB|nr:hypothetical protein SAMN04489759_11544 [Sulfitobacter delicatus]
MHNDLLTKLPKRKMLHALRVLSQIPDSLRLQAFSLKFLDSFRNRLTHFCSSHQATIDVVAYR